ncbi:MAG TPA: hypothetical protein VGO03_01130 [Acidimicrobiia bacterium]
MSAAVDPPSTLHQYTDAAGLFGIVNSRELWATDCRFLNDSTEYQLGLELVTNALVKMPNPRSTRRITCTRWRTRSDRPTVSLRASWSTTSRPGFMRTSRAFALTAIF